MKTAPWSQTAGLQKKLSKEFLRIQNFKILAKSQGKGCRLDTNFLYNSTGA
jgi:hypothetical protein